MLQAEQQERIVQVWACCQMEQGNWVTNNVEKAEVLSGFFASIFASNTVFTRSQPPETRRESWNKEEVTSVVNQHRSAFKLDIQKSMTPDRLHAELLRILANAFARPLNHLLIWEGFYRLVRSKYHSCLQEKLERRYEELPASQPSCSSWEGEKEYPPRKHFQTCGRQ